MLIKIESQNMGKANYRWLKTIYHFSFANYYNEDNLNFGVLRVLNDDIISPKSGFDPHPHENMEIITYVVKGELTHKDSMNNERTVTRGEVQYMSAGTGVTHSEFNNSDIPLRLLQLWIYPDCENYLPNYGDYSYPFEDRMNKWLHIVSSDRGIAPIKIHQDVNIYVCSLDDGNKIDFQVHEDRQAYFVQIEGNSKISNLTLEERDALEIIEESITIEAITLSHFIIIEMSSI